jgi:hypothetical protein
MSEFYEPNYRDNERKTVKTSDGFEWTEVKPGYWKDESTGLVWGPKLNGEYTFKDAQKEALRINELDLKWSVPTKKEWMQAEIHDVREVLPDIKYWFWSSSPYPNYSDSAYLFNGNLGSVGYDFRYYTYSVRAVGR